MLVLCFLLLLAVASSKILPDYVPQCKRSDPQLEKCVLDAVEVMKPYLLKGIPEINVPPYDPLRVPTLKINRTAPSLRIKAVIKNMLVHGPSAFRIDKLKIDLSNNKYAGELKLFLPRIHVTCDYDIRGSRILVLDMDGKGKLSGNFTGIAVLAKGTGKVIEKDGVEYIQVDKISAKVRVKDGQVAFDDTERPVVANSAASFFNASPRTVLDIINPIIEDTGAAVFRAMINKIFAAIPLKELLVEE